MKEEVKNGITITIVVVLTLILVYLATAFFLTGEIGGKKTTTTKDSSSVTTLYQDMILASKTFERPEEEYMVIFFSEKDAKKRIKSYMKSYYNDDIKLYKVNLDESINKFVVSKDEENKEAKNANELKIKDTTLIVIKNKSIVSYITDTDEIVEKIKIDLEESEDSEE